MVKIRTFFLKIAQKFGYIMRYDVIVGRRYDRCEAIYQHLQDEWKYAH